jgi:CDP-diacylglycerol--glycerol-3-phosphate 3-phosphatidyltransferase
MTPPRATVWTLPNQLTLARFPMAALLFLLIWLEAWPWCLAVFALAAFTDWLDGWVARVWKLTSALGRSLDPLADKVLTCGAFIFLLPVAQAKNEGWMLPWMVTVVVCRELIIATLRGYLESLGAKFGADWFGKVKTVLQFAALVAIFVMLMKTADWPEWLRVGGDWLRLGLVYGMVLATILSGLQYLWKAAVLLRT